MKRVGWWALTALVVMGGLAPLRVQAQTGANGTKANTLTGAPLIYYESDSTRRAVSDTYGLPARLTNPDWSKTGTWTNAIFDTIMPFPVGAIGGIAAATLVHNAESTAVIPTEGFRVITAALKAWAPAPVDSNGFMAFAIQVRGHLTQSADSASTFPIMEWHTVSGGAQSASAQDSLGGKNPPWPNLANPTERLVYIPAAYSLPAGATNRTPRALFGNNGVAFTIPARGGAFAFPYISIRVRTISTGSTTPSAAGNAPRVALHLYGGR